MSSRSFEKFIEEISALTVLDLADLVKELEAKFGVSASAPVSAAPAQGATEEAAAVSEQAEYKVVLEEAGPKKIDSIKALRKVTTLGLTEAKKVVEETPSVIAEAASKEDAHKIKAALEEVGAKVKLS